MPDHRLFHRLVRVALIAGAATSVAAGQDLQAAPVASGVVVVRVHSPLAAHDAGLRAGDVIARWRLRPAAEDAWDPAELTREELLQQMIYDTVDEGVHSPLMLDWLEREHGSRQAVFFAVRRGAQELELRVRPGEWGLETVPALAGEQLAACLRAHELMQGGRFAEARELWKTLLTGSRTAPPEVVTWLRLQRLQAELSCGDFVDLEQRLEDTVEVGEAMNDYRLWGAMHLRIAALLEAGKGYGFAALFCVRAAMKCQLGPNRISLCVCLARLARLSAQLAPRDRDQVLSVAKEVLDHRITRLTDLARLAVQLHESTTPRPSSVLVDLLLLSSELAMRGADDVPTALAMAKRAVEAARAFDATGFELSRALGHVAMAHMMADRWEEAERTLHEALSLEERHRADSPLIPLTLDLLGTIAVSRKDLLAAQDYADRAAAFRLARNEAPGGATELLLEFFKRDDQVAQANGDDVLMRAMRLGAARRYDESLPLLRTAILTELERGEPTERLVELYLLTAATCESMAEMQEALEASERAYTAAGAVSSPMLRARAAHSWGKLMTHPLVRFEPRGDRPLFDFGAAASRRALELYVEALGLVQARLPDSELELRLHRDMAVARLFTNDPDGAEASFLEAVRVADARVDLIGGDHHVRARASGEDARAYESSIDHLMFREKPAAAFEVLERSRARVLKWLLSTHDRVGPRDAATVQRLATLRAEYEDAYGALTRADLPDAALTALRMRLSILRSEYLRTGAAGSASARARRDAEAMSVQEIARGLQGGTVLLSYHVGTFHSYAFVLAADGKVEALELELAEAGLQEAVQAVLGRIARPGPGRGIEIRTDRRAAAAAPTEVDPARRLYDVLLAPVEERLRDARRVLICASGPLVELPFAALRRPDGRFLAQWKPIHFTASASTYARSGRRGPAAAATSFVGVGDPTYRTRAGGALRTTLVPLPASRAEVVEVAKFFPGGVPLVHAEATEERVRKECPTANVIHFACHALLDAASPLDSALVVAPGRPDQTNDDGQGFLHAWEIVEDLRVQADLVTLAACRSGSGEVVPGEGMMGLTWAFQCAGARSTLSALWDLPDAVTAMFMKTFYARWRAGVSKDEALQQAQCDLIRLGLPPGLWAGFKLEGRWD